MKIIRQKDLKDCGICALKSIIKYYNGDVPLETMRIDAKVSSNGTTAYDLIEASKKYGFDAYGIKCDNLNHADIILPAIAHLNFKNGLSHYVVIYKVTNNKVILMDPAKGKVVMNLKDFYEVWSNIILVFYPSRPLVLIKSDNNLLHFLKNIFITEKRLLSRIIIYSIVLTLTTIIGSYYFQFIIDAINNNYDFSYIKMIIIVFAIILIVKLYTTHLRNYLENHLNKNIDVYLNSEFLRHLFNLPLEVISSRTSGEIVTRIYELANIKSLVTDLFIQCFLDFSLSLIAIPLLLTINSTLFLILILFIAIYLIIGIVTSKVIYKKAYQNIDYQSNFNNTLIENINMYGTIKNLNVTSYSLKRIEESLSAYLNDAFFLNNYINKILNIKNWLNELCMFVINTYGFYLIFTNKLNISVLITFNTLVNLFINPIKNTIDSLPKYNFLKASFSKLNEFICIEEEKLGEKSNLNSSLIEVKNLSYSYNGMDKLLDNISFKINPGDFITLKGPSGSGKSTLCKILDAYITNYEGSILIDGINIKDLSTASIRNEITYVSQEENLFTGTIKNNILLGRKIDNKRFAEICKICEVDKIVDKKKMRYESIISNSLENISGGEKERIILARALLNDSKIIILDEALSEVDYKLERKIINNLKMICSDKIIIYITHKNHYNLFNKIINIGGQNELSKAN